MIDYQLCLEVQDLSGIEYVNEYLKRLCAENVFLQSFPEKQIRRLLRARCPDFEDQIDSLLEPVAACAMGLCLLGRDVFSLDMTDADQCDLSGLFGALSDDEAAKMLQKTATVLSAHFGKVEELEQCLCRAAENLTLRFGALKGQDGFFRLFPSPDEADNGVQAGMRYVDGESLEDEALRDLIETLRDLRDVREKAALVRQKVRSLRDLTEILNCCFWGGESTMLLDSFTENERAVIRQYIAEKKKADPAWGSDSGWETSLTEVE
jgi:hypothetical protein